MSGGRACSGTASHELDDLVFIWDDAGMPDDLGGRRSVFLAVCP